MTTEVEATEKLSETPARHSLLWLDDGNVVLATDTLLFRVHKTVLSLNSSVFKDMFDLPYTSGDTSNAIGPAREGLLVTTPMGGDSYEGLPMVTLVGDSGDDVACLLRAIYEPGYYECDNDDTPFEVVAALLLLGSKYDFSKLRKNVIKHIIRHYPTTLEEYEALPDDDEQLFGRMRCECHLELLQAAFKAQAAILLPGLYYASSNLPLHQVLANRRLRQSECFETLLLGKEFLEENIQYSFAVTTGGFAVHCTVPGRCRLNTLSAPRLGNLFSSSDVKSLSTTLVEEACQTWFCAACRDEISSIIDRVRG